MNSTRQKGHEVGGWTLVRYLGKGGNAEVWEATRDDGNGAALKLLHEQFFKPDSQRYKRFLDEAGALRRLRAKPGILPFIDAHLPEQPSNADPPWVATVLATEVQKHIRKTGANLSVVVEAVRTFADTLASLHAESYFHRDIKPANLYYCRDCWVIGDFGLVDFPDKGSETVVGEKLGAENFVAPEMLLGRPDALFASVDVYALAKTLWVLAAGQNYPPPGLQRVEDRNLVLDAYVKHPRAYLLDRLIEGATSPNPSERPSMKEMGAELEAWLSDTVASRRPANLSDLAARFAALEEPARRAEKLREHQIELAKEAVKALEQRLQPLTSDISSIVPFPVTLAGGGVIRNAVQSKLPGGQDEWNTGVEIVVCSPGRAPVTLWSGAAVFLYSTGHICIAVSHIVSAHPMHGPMTTTWSKWQSVRVGSAEQEQVIGQLVGELTEHAHDAVETFLKQLHSNVTEPK
jgi:serine/threonine protein kinase